MNEESLGRANAFLAAVAARVKPGEMLDVSPTRIGRQVGMEQPLAAARAVRALLARRRLEAVGGNYRLLDARPLDPDEPESVARAPRRRAGRGRGTAKVSKASKVPTYSDVGHVAIERLIELGREVASLRAGARASRDEARRARQAKDEAEHRTHDLETRVHDLEAKLDMAEQNMRSLLAAAKGTGREETVASSSEMEAILGILKTPTKTAEV